MPKIIVATLVVYEDDPDIDVTVPDDTLAGDLADCLRSSGWDESLVGITVNALRDAPKAKVPS